MLEKPGKSKLRSSIFAFHEIPKEKRKSSIFFTNLIRDTSQWKALSKAIDLLEQKKKITYNDALKAKQMLFDEWKKKFTISAAVSEDFVKFLSSPPEGLQIRKGFSKIFSENIMSHLINEKTPVMGCITADKKKKIEIFLDRKTGNVKIVEIDLKPQSRL